MSLKSSQPVEGRPGPAVLSVKVVEPSISVAKNTETLSQVSNFSEDLFSILFACCHLFLNSDTYVFRASFWFVGKIVWMLLFSSNLTSIIFDRFQFAILFKKILDSDSYSANPKTPEFTYYKGFFGNSDHSAPNPRRGSAQSSRGRRFSVISRKMIRMNFQNFVFVVNEPFPTIIG